MTGLVTSDTVAEVLDKVRLLNGSQKLVRPRLVANWIVQPVLMAPVMLNLAYPPETWRPSLGGACAKLTAGAGSSASASRRGKIEMEISGDVLIQVAFAVPLLREHKLPHGATYFAETHDPH